MHKNVIYCRLTFFAVNIFEYKRDMKIILMKIYCMQIHITLSIFAYALNH